MSIAKCPTPEQIRDCYDDKLSNTEINAIEDHLASCELCAAYADEVVRPSVLPLAGMNTGLAASVFPQSPSVGRYRFEEEIGRGGMGVVFRAFDPQLSRDVAIKVVQRRRADIPASIARHEIEARALARLNDSGIVQIHDVIEDQDRFYLVMEYVKGTPLSRLGPIDPATAARYIRDAAVAIAHMHEAGLIHRDVKPSNLICAKSDGRVKVLDLGIARGFDLQPGFGPRTSSGMIVGTRDYMAPEQIAKPQTAGPPADIFALGCTLHTLLHGHPPQRDVVVTGRLPISRLRDGKAVFVPRALKMLLWQMLATDPTDRPTAAAVAAVLDKFVGAQARLNHRSRSSRVMQWAMLTLLGVTIVGASLFARSWFDRQPAALVPAQASNPDQSLPQPEAGANTQSILLVARGRPGHFASIGAALEKAQPNSVIRVVDNATYEESIRFVPRQHAGVTLEATAGATLVGPADDWAIVIDSVPGLIVRGFRLRRPRSTDWGLICIADRSPGIILDQLDLDTPGEGGDGILIRGRTTQEGDTPAVIQRCRIAGGRRGIAVAGLDADTTQSLAGGTIRIEGNSFARSLFGIGLEGELCRIMMVGNRFEATKVAIQITALKVGSGDILIGNNTFLDTNSALQHWRPIDEYEPIGGLAFVANLVLGSKRGDVLFIDGEPGVGDLIGYLDGQTFASTWQVSRNVREGKAPDRSAAWVNGWVPPGPTDLLIESIAKIERNPTHGNYLRPPSGGFTQQLGGSANEPGMPLYIGAISPSGEPAWNWARTWTEWSKSWKPRTTKPGPTSALDRITVSRKYTADFDNLTDALARKRGPALDRLIRVLDDETYEESFNLNQEDHSHLTIEAPRAATLKPTQPNRHGILVDRPSSLVIRGFRFRGLPSRNQAYIFVAGPSPGLYLEGLHFEGGHCNGVWFENAAIPDDADPAIVWNCVFERLETGLGISSSDRPCRRIRVVGNTFTQTSTWLAGPMQRIHLVGNFFSRTNGSAMTLWPDPAQSDHLLIANNTFWECHGVACLRGDGPSLAEPIGRLCNNLVVAAVDDDLIAHKLASNSNHEPADGSSVATRWRIDHNWRDVRRSQGDASYVPPSVDERADANPPVASTKSGDPNFLKPNLGSVLATGGAGGEGLPLPTYIGWTPPDGGMFWQWDLTWSTPP